MQVFYQLQRQAKANPNNADVAKRLEDQTKKVEGLEERIAKHEKTAKELDQQIRAAAQPKPRHYRLTRVGEAKVSGAVIYKGKPVGEAEVVFVGSNGREARGRTDNVGRYTLQFGPEVGAIAGTYNVVINGSGVSKKYGSTQITPLRVEIRSPGNNTFDFSLND